MISDDDLEKLAKEYVESWHKRNNWAPTERSSLPAVTAYIAGFLDCQQMMQDRWPDEKECWNALREQRGLSDMYHWLKQKIFHKGE